MCDIYIIIGGHSIALPKIINCIGIFFILLSNITGLYIDNYVSFFHNQWTFFDGSWLLYIITSTPLIIIIIIIVYTFQTE